MCVLPCRQVWLVAGQSQRGSAAQHTAGMTSPTPRDVDAWRHRWRHRPVGEQRASSIDHNTHTHPFNGHFSGTTQVSRYQKGKNKSGFYWSKRQWVAVASAGTYASLHLAPDR